MYYLGVDLNDRYAMVSYYHQNMNEPETVSTTMGGEVYQIPALLARKKTLGLWYYGEEAKRMAKTSEVVCVDMLLKRAVGGEMIGIGGEEFDSVDLLALFLKKVVELPGKLGAGGPIDRLVIALDRLTEENMSVLWKVASRLGLSPGQFAVVDYKESFYYYALSQKEQLWTYDVFLFDCCQDMIYSYDLKRDTSTRPQLVTIRESSKRRLGEEKDQAFLEILQKSFENRMVSAVYLVGSGFEGDWLKGSIDFMCKGRHAFLGNNLFSKGACHAAIVRDESVEWPFIYMGENEMKFNLSLKVRNRGDVAFYNLISAGRNWFETRGECEVILCETTGIDFWKQMPNSREAKIETLELTDLPNRPDGTTRVRIIARPVADDKIEIEIKDLGFGEFFRGTDKIWKHTITM